MNVKSDMRSELAIKRDEWLEGIEGKTATNPDILLYTSYRGLLRNRIEAAFLAGAKANEEVRQEICDKLAELIIKKP